jgi:hypothetical protein
MKRNLMSAFQQRSRSLHTQSFVLPLQAGDLCGLVCRWQCCLRRRAPLATRRPTRDRLADHPCPDALQTGQFLKAHNVKACVIGATDLSHIADRNTEYRSGRDIAQRHSQSSLSAQTFSSSLCHERWQANFDRLLRRSRETQFVPYPFAVVRCVWHGERWRCH